MTDLDGILTQRGILDAAILAEWEACDNGWKYPVLSVRGEVKAYRWKSADGSSPKYRWLPEKPTGTSYYFLPGALSAITQRNGRLYLAAGEPDVLAYNAAGIRNVLCWFDGETAIPPTFVRDLRLMGVEWVYYAPDRDVTGMQAAHKLHATLKDSGIDLTLFQLPGDVGSKTDVNQFWTDTDCDRKTFEARLVSLPALDMVDVYLYAQHTPSEKTRAGDIVAGQIELWRETWVNDIIKALGPCDMKEGKTERWRCPLPHHGDRNPSFSITRSQNKNFPWPVCSCGIQDHRDAWEQVASAVGVDAWDDYKARQAVALGYERPVLGDDMPPATVTKQDAPLWVDMRDVYRQLQAELRGEFKPSGRYIVNPLTVLHRFGGFAKFFRTGKLIAVTGVSGGGKTTAAQTICVMAMREGHDVIWWGPEWDPYEYAEVGMQREGGLTFDQLQDWRVMRDLAGEDPAKQKQISAQYNLQVIPNAKVQDSIARIETVINMPGTMYVIPTYSEVNEVMRLSKAIADAKRAEGRTVSFFVFDYIQLAIKSGKHDWTWAEDVAGIIKRHIASDNGGADLVGIVNAQSRKDDTEKVLKGEELSHASAQGLSDQKFNLYLTITPGYVDEAPQDWSTLSVRKNNKGRKGSVIVPMDYDRMLIVDKELKKVTVELNGESTPAARAAERE